ncbi:hypothetical protein JCM5350_008084 [Sporobolomyces pararoseus]
MAEDTTLPEEWQTLSSPKIPEFKVWVTMGGKVLTSHKKDTLEHASVGAEIAGIEGREFKVHTYDGRTQLSRPFEIDVRLDGKYVTGSYQKKPKKEDLAVSYFGRPADSQRRFRTHWRTLAGKNHVRPFVFGKIATTSHAINSSKTAEALVNVGTIKIEYRGIKNVRVVRVSKKEKEAETDTDTDDDESRYEDSLSKVEPIDEKAKKAQFGLSAGLGQLIEVKRDNATSSSSSSSKSGWTHETKYDRSEGPPIVTYTFRIRSPIGLQDEILPDEPVASTSKRQASSQSDEDDDSDLDEEEIDAQLKALEEKAARLKAKRAKTSKPDVKPQVTPSPPYDWQGQPPIKKETRWYLDFDAEEAEKEEERMIEKEKQEEEERRKNAVHI